VRVIGGQWRGRVLRAPRGRATRPTADMVREAIFDILGGLLIARGGEQTVDPYAALEVVDLYAGSGALGIEALSRGAARCTFVEQHKSALRTLRRNLECLGVAPARVRVVGRPVADALAADAREGVQYTLLLADPPYGEYRRAEAELAALIPAVLAPAGVVVVETARGQAVRLPLHSVRDKTYGDTRVTVMVREDAIQPGSAQGKATSTGGDEPCPIK